VYSVSSIIMIFSIVQASPAYFLMEICGLGVFAQYGYCNELMLPDPKYLMSIIVTILYKFMLNGSDSKPLSRVTGVSRTVVTPPSYVTAMSGEFSSSISRIEINFMYSTGSRNSKVM